MIPALSPLGETQRGGYALMRPPFSTWTESLATVVQADGKIVICGTVNLGTPLSIPFNTSQFRFAWLVSRYNANGSLDTTFGSFGWTIITFDANTATYHDNEATSVAQLANGKILVGGIRTLAGPSWGVGIAQLNSDGTLDQSFGTDGQTSFIVGGLGNYFSAARIGFQSTGKLLIATTFNASSGGDRMQVWRFTLNGVLDTSFGSNGFYGEVYAAGEPCQLWAMDIDANDKIIMAGGTTTGVGAQTGWFICRLTVNGAADTTFGGAGFSSDGILLTFSFDLANAAYGAIAIPGGKYVIFGQTSYNIGGDGQYAVAQLTTLGALDTAAFNAPNGFIETNLSGSLQPTQSPAYNGAVRLSNGKIACFGASLGNVPGQGFSDGGQFLIVQYNSNGTLDTGYGTGGYFSPSLGSSSETFYGAAGDGTNTYGVGHAMNDVLSPREAIGFLFKFLPTAVTAPTFGDVVGANLPTKPACTTNAASSPGQTTATLNGTLVPNGDPGGNCSYRFDYGLTVDYGLQTASTVATGGSQAVSATPTGLLSGYLYHFRLIATGPGGQTFGTDQTFTTTSGAVNTLYYDTFTDVNGTFLQNHTPDINNTQGGFWTNVNGPTNATITGNKVVNSTGDYQEYVTTGVLNCTTQCDFVWNGTGSAFMGIQLRIADVNNYWIIYVNGINFRIDERVAGGQTNRATSPQGIVGNTAYTIRVVVSGTTITATINGGNTISYGSMASLTANKTAGFELFGGNASAANFLLTSP